MTKFIMVYKGPATDPASMSPEQSKMIMDQWNAWFGKMGKSIVDGGAPLGKGASVLDNGKNGSAAELSGYTIVEAKDLAAAKAMTSGHPFLSEGKGRFSIDIFEVMPMPGGM